MTKPPTVGPKEQKLRQLREARAKGRPPIDFRKSVAKIKPMTSKGGRRGR
jgi:hypothetical protein